MSCSPFTRTVSVRTYVCVRQNVIFYSQLFLLSTVVCMIHSEHTEDISSFKPLCFASFSTSCFPLPHVFHPFLVCCRNFLPRHFLWLIIAVIHTSYHTFIEIFTRIIISFTSIEKKIIYDSGEDSFYFSIFMCTKRFAEIARGHGKRQISIRCLCSVRRLHFLTIVPMFIMHIPFDIETGNLPISS